MIMAEEVARLYNETFMRKIDPEILRGEEGYSFEKAPELYKKTSIEAFAEILPQITAQAVAQERAMTIGLLREFVKKHEDYLGDYGEFSPVNDDIEEIISKIEKGEGQ